MELWDAIIAAINGPAVGIGATMPLSWDIRLASESAKIGFVFTRRGIIPEANSSWILPRIVGLSKAMDLLLTGRPPAWTLSALRDRPDTLLPILDEDG